MSKNKLKLAAVAALGILISATALPAKTVVNLGFILDGSGSVGEANFNAARNALATAISANIPTNDANFEYKIGVSVFGQTGVVGLSAVTVTDATSLNAAVTGIQGITYGSGYNTGATCFNCGFNFLNTAFGGSVAAGDISIVNMTTDGNNNQGGAANSGLLSGNGWDSLSFEAVGSNVSTTPLVALGFDTVGAGATLIGNVNLITDPLNNAFVIQVSDFGTQYAAIIDRKVRTSVTPDPIPLPAGLPLLAGGLMFFGFVARRRKNAA